MKKLIFLVLVMIAASGFLVSPARAQTVEECQGLIDRTSADLASATIVGNNPDQTRAGLQGKLDAASAKLSEGKYEDAIDKLVDFRSTVERLASAPKPKIGQEDAALLVADADAAIACIQGLITEG